jgi:hypothetical protein
MLILHNNNEYKGNQKCFTNNARKPGASLINFIPSKINTKCMLIIIIIIINFRLVNGSTFFEGEFLHLGQCLEFF